MGHWISCLSIALFLAASALSAAAAVTPVRTTSLGLRDDVSDPGRRALRFRAVTSKDAVANRIIAPAPGGAADPTIVGAVLTVENAAGSGERAQIALPAAGWTRRGTTTNPQGYLYRDAVPGAAISKVLLKDDLLRARGGGAAFAYTLDEPQQSRIGLRLDSGADAWCAEAPARASGNPPSTANNDAPERFEAAGNSPAPTACTIGPRFALTVQNGYGSGAYPVGATVHVWAALDPADQLLSVWSGDDAVLAEPLEWHTTLVMPARDATVAAAIVDRPTTLAVSQFGGPNGTPKTVRRFIPPAPRGLVLILHGTGGSANFITSTEAFAVALRLIESGYGVLGTEAEEAVVGDLDGDGKERWNAALTPTNLDLATLDALVADLRGSGAIGAATPLFALGMSNGGSMAVTLGAVDASAVAPVFPNLTFAAVISHCASARAGSVAVTTTPSAWFMCQNDDNENVGGAGNADAAANSAALAGRGVPTLYDEHPASPLYDARFERIGLASGTSAALAADLRAAGFVGAGGFFTLGTDALTAAVLAMPSLAPTLAALSPAQQRNVIDQLRAMQAEHQMFSDWAARAAAWFDAHGTLP